LNSKNIIFDRMITKLNFKLTPMEIITKKLENNSKFSQSKTVFFISKKQELKENIYFDIYILENNLQNCGELTKCIIHLLKEIPYINVIFIDKHVDELQFSEVFSINNYNSEITNYLIDNSNSHTSFLFNLLNDLKNISNEKIISPVDKIKFNNLL